MKAEHRPVYDDGVLRIAPTGSPGGLAISGEIDEATYPALVTCLHELADGHQQADLDLSGLSYCDLAGLRAIVRLAGGGPGDARRIRLHDVPQHIRVMLAITGWDRTPGLAVQP